MYSIHGKCAKNITALRTDREQVIIGPIILCHPVYGQPVPGQLWPLYYLLSVDLLSVVCYYVHTCSCILIVSCVVATIILKPRTNKPHICYTPESQCMSSMPVMVPQATLHSPCFLCCHCWSRGMLHEAIIALHIQSKHLVVVAADDVIVVLQLFVRLFPSAFGWSSRFMSEAEMHDCSHESKFPIVVISMECLDGTLE